MLDLRIKCQQSRKFLNKDICINTVKILLTENCKQTSPTWSLADINLCSPNFAFSKVIFHFISTMLSVYSQNQLKCQCVFSETILSLTLEVIYLKVKETCCLTDRFLKKFWKLLARLRSVDKYPSKNSSPYVKKLHFLTPRPFKKTQFWMGTSMSCIKCFFFSYFMWAKMFVYLIHPSLFYKPGFSKQINLTLGDLLVCFVVGSSMKIQISFWELNHLEPKCKAVSRQMLANKCLNGMFGCTCLETNE